MTNFSTRKILVGTDGHDFGGCLFMPVSDLAKLIMAGVAVGENPRQFGGIDAVAGTVVDDVEMVLRCVSQGANYRQIQGVRQLAMLKD